MARLLALLLTALLSAASAQSPAPAASTWQKPPPEVDRVLNAPELPALWMSPTRDKTLLASADNYPPLADLSRAALRLAGTRFYPSSRALVGETCTRALTLKRLDTGAETPIPLPAEACVVRLRRGSRG